MKQWTGELAISSNKGQWRVVFARDLIKTLRRRELDAAAAKLSTETGSAICRRPKASMCRASTASASHSRRGGSP